MNCDACGAEFVDGKHPNVTCSDKEWAIHQARLLGRIAYLLEPKTATVQTGKTKSASE